jgi:D-alanyl-D-alanine carboxypeptidase
MQRKLTILTIIISALISVNVYFLVIDAGIRDPQNGPAFNSAQAYLMPVTQADYLPILDTSAGEVKLDARAAIVYDVTSDKNLFVKSPRQKLPIASLTKILTSIVVWENLSPSDVVTVQSSAVKVDGQRQDLYTGEKISVNNLMQLMLIESSNDAAYALADFSKTKGIDLIGAMNSKAASLGMIDTKIFDTAGLDDKGYSTVQDLVKAVKYALRYDAIWNFSREKSATIVSADGKFSHEIQSTNQLLGVLSDIVGGKTGYTDTALGCMILIVDIPKQNDKIISIVLGSHGRFEDMKNLVQWATRAYRWE